MTYTAGYIGHDATPNSLDADGVWDISEMCRAKRDGIWPYDIAPDANLELLVDARHYLGSGTTLTDLSGKGNHGTIQSGVTFNSNGWFEFNGSTGYISFPLVTSAQTNVTIMALARVSSASTSGCLVSNGRANGYAYGVGLNSMDNNGNDLIAVYPYIAWFDSNTAVGTGWKVLTLTIDAAEDPDLYSDTSLVFSGANNITSVTTGTYIGRTIGDEPSGPRGWDGDIEAVAIYSKLLSTEEFEHNVNAWLARHA